MDLFILTGFLLFLLFCSGFFSASETALFSLPTTKVKAYHSSTDPRKRLLAKLVLEPKDLLVTVFMLNTLVNILIQNTTSSIFGMSASWTLKVGVPFILMLFFGEIIPKYIGLQNNIYLSEMVVYPINFLQKFLKPIRTLIVNITAPISRVLFFFLKKEESISREEIKHVLKTSQEHGVLHPDEAELIWGYLNFQESTVKQLMRPRSDVIFFDINDPISKLLYLFIEQECSRIPVCDKSLDTTYGIITAEKYFLYRHHIKKGQDLIKYLSKPLFVPQTTSARSLEKQFEDNKQVLALVVDEYGSISGLITREDLIEVVIGEITDLRDAKDLYMKAGVNEIIASGRLELSEFNSIFRSNLQSANNMMTIAGWLVEQIQDLPKSGTKFEIDNFLFHVLAADPHRIRRLYIRKLPEKKNRQELENHV